MEKQNDKSKFKNEIKIEVFTGHKPFPAKIIYKVMKSICKIMIETKKGIYFELDCAWIIQIH